MVKDSFEAVVTRLYNIRQETISGDNVYQFIVFFDELYARSETVLAREGAYIKDALSYYYLI